LLYPIV